MLRVAKVILAVFVLNTVFKCIFGGMVFGFMVCWSRFVSRGGFMVGGSGFVSRCWFVIHWGRFVVSGSRFVSGSGFMVSGSRFMVCRWRWGRFVSWCGWWHISGSGCRFIY